MARAARAAVQDDADTTADDNVDKVSEVDEIRTGQVSEDELTLARSVAKRMGWTPKEEWKRDPAKWVDAPDFLENTPRELELAKDRLRRNAQATEAVIEEERRRSRQQAIDELRAAERAGDTERANAAVERVQATEGPPPQIAAWIRENPWFNDDPAARALAAATTDRLKARPIAEQLEAAEQEVRRRFPEHFGQAETHEEPRETRLSEVRRPPPMANGSRGPGSTPKEKGFSDIPAGDRATFNQKLLKHFRSRNMSEAEAQAKYAQSYWRDQA